MRIQPYSKYVGEQRLRKAIMKLVDIDYTLFYEVAVRINLPIKSNSKVIEMCIDKYGLDAVFHYAFRQLTINYKSGGLDSNIQKALDVVVPIINDVSHLWEYPRQNYAFRGIDGDVEFLENTSSSDWIVGKSGDWYYYRKELRFRRFNNSLERRYSAWTTNIEIAKKFSRNGYILFTLIPYADYAFYPDVYFNNEYRRENEVLLKGLDMRLYIMGHVRHLTNLGVFE